MRTSFIKNRTAAVILAVFCTLPWGTAFPFIKLGYAAFGVESAGDKLLFGGIQPRSPHR